MATKFKNAPAPATLDAFQLVEQNLKTNERDLKALATEATTIGTDRGFTPAFAMAKKLDLNAEAMLLWQPQALSAKEVNTQEAAVRAWHAKLHPASAKGTLDAISTRLQLAIDASTDGAVQQARDGGSKGIPGSDKFRVITKRSDDANAVAARTNLEAMRDASKGNADVVADIQRYIDAINNPDLLVALGANKNRVSKNYSRFRALMYLGEIASTFTDCVDENERGKKYEQAGAAAVAAHKKYFEDVAAQFRNVDDLRNAIHQAVRDAVGTRAPKAPLSDEEKEAKAVADLYNAARRCVDFGRLSQVGFDNLKAWMLSSEGDERNVDVEGDRLVAEAAEKAAKAAEEQKKRDDAAKLANRKTPPRAPNAPATTKGKAKASAKVAPKVTPAPTTAPAKITPTGRRVVAGTGAPPAVKANVTTSAKVGANVLGALKR